ncbi:MAG: diacylglycerol kinase family protein, partial [Acidocella sp.]|nr:diacylglycerol kinase family protein [Acidocella sp.]
AAALWKVLDLLMENGIKLEVAETQHAGHAAELARTAARDGVEMVVAAGGDGTIAEVANGLIGSPTVLGVIPLGTANVLAKEYRLSTSPRGVASALAYKRTQPLWPGLARLGAFGHAREPVRGHVREHIFVQMVGLGFDGAVVHGLQPLLKRVIGRGAYVWQSLWESVAYGFPGVQLSVDGKDYQASSVVVSKGRLYGGPYMLAPNGASTKPGFQVALFENPGTFAALLAGAALPLGLLPRCPGVRVISGSEIMFETANGPILTQSDGDRLAGTPHMVVDAQSPISLIVG